MIRQQPGDILEIHFDDLFYYVVVLTPIVMFGGNIVFAFHGDGSRREVESLRADSSGFNVCTDLRLPKREGDVKRMKKVDDTTPFWRTQLAKGSHEHRPGHKAEEWWIYKIEDLMNHIDRTSHMTKQYREAMDYSCSSFDLIAEKIRSNYTPDKHPCL